MQQLQEKSLRALEFDRIRELLAEHCTCAGSAERAKALEPFEDSEDAGQALLETSDACRLTVRFGAPSFMGVSDLSTTLRRAKVGSSLTPQELLRVAGALATLRGLKRYRESSAEMATSLDGRFDSLSSNRYLEDKIGAAILSEDEIADSASGELSDIRRHMRLAGVRVREQLDKMIRSPQMQKFLQEPIVTIRGGRFVVPVRAECKSEVSGLVHDTSASGATLFVEPMAVVEANNELRLLGAKEQKEIERILAELSAEVGQFADPIGESIDTAVELDFIFAKSRLAFKMNAVAPKLNTDGYVELRHARHPLLDPKQAVPVDLRLGGDFETLVITGPNTGGKTVALKTLGLLCLMAASGLMIPAADDSSVCLFDEVLADIGDEQSIEQSLSTFSAHMTNIIGILGVCSPGSLVLLDELGSGTDPVEGAALAVSILEYLRGRKARVAATTHYAELKIYALETEGVENACCEFDIATLRPTYRLLIGVPGRSNAFAISERLGLGKEIIERAKTLVPSESSRFEQVVENLETSRQQMEGEREKARALRLGAERAKDEAERLRKELDDSREKELERAHQQARRIVEQTRAQAQTLLDELEELRKMKASEDLTTLRELAKSQIGSRMRDMENTADPVAEKRRGFDVYRLPRALRRGDTVRIADIDKKGTVLREPDASGYVEVQAGIITTRVPLANLRLVEGEAEEQKRRYGVKTSIDRSKIAVRPELDLRGKTSDEALLELDRFLDDAALAGLSLVTIIHGKGTGALRAAVQQHLKGIHGIKSFRLGRYGEGEDGVTIVELE